MNHRQTSVFPFINGFFPLFWVYLSKHSLRLNFATNSCTFIYPKGFRRYVPYLNRETLLNTLIINTRKNTPFCCFTVIFPVIHCYFPVIFLVISLLFLGHFWQKNLQNHVSFSTLCIMPYIYVPALNHP